MGAMTDALVFDARLSHVLSPAGRSEAVRLLQGYFAPLRDGGFEGGRFERFAGGGDRSHVQNTFTAEDLVAVTMLSVDLKAKAALSLLETDADEFTGLLGAVSTTDRFELLPVDVVADESWPVLTLYRRLRGLPGVGETRATKLLSRKRPHLVPVIDSVVRAELGRGVGPFWVPLHRWLTAEDLARATWLRELGDEAGLADISILRIFDVLAWRVGSGK